MCCTKKKDQYFLTAATFYMYYYYKLLLLSFFFLQTCDNQQILEQLVWTAWIYKTHSQVSPQRYHQTTK